MLSATRNMLRTTTRIALASRRAVSCHPRRASIERASIRVETLGAMTATFTAGPASAAIADAMTINTVQGNLFMGCGGSISSNETQDQRRRPKARVAASWTD